MSFDFRAALLERMKECLETGIAMAVKHDKNLQGMEIEKIDTEVKFGENNKLEFISTVEWKERKENIGATINRQ